MTNVLGAAVALRGGFSFFRVPPGALSAGQRSVVQLDDSRPSTRFEPHHVGRPFTAAGFLNVLWATPVWSLVPGADPSISTQRRQARHGAKRQEIDTFFGLANFAAQRLCVK